MGIGAFVFFKCFLSFIKLISDIYIRFLREIVIPNKIVYFLNEIEFLKIESLKNLKLKEIY
jgi:hypothetical protein